MEEERFIDETRWTKGKYKTNYHYARRRCNNISVNKSKEGLAVYIQAARSRS